MIALNKLPRKSRQNRTARQKLRFTPTAWAKLLFLRDAGPTEVGMFGISSPDDLLLVNDVALVRQHCTAVTTAFDDTSVADFLDVQIDLGRSPQECCRIWLHTHPGDCPHPSGTDEETFADAFGGPDWSVLFIIARGGQTYCRMQTNAGPGMRRRIGVEVDFDTYFDGSDHDAWAAEYADNVLIEDPFRGTTNPSVPWPDGPSPSLERWNESEWVAS